MFIEDILCNLPEDNRHLDDSSVAALNPLVLAYIGDAVFELYIRVYLVASEPYRSVQKLHNMSVSHVKAHAQCELAHKITPYLTEEELGILKRGRNSKSGYAPKNADVIEYRIATGFEALVGYLYLTGRTKRLLEIMKYLLDDGQDDI